MPKPTRARAGFTAPKSNFRAQQPRHNRFQNSVDAPFHPRSKSKKTSEAITITETISPVNLPAFSELGLDESILRAASELGFETPTPIQAHSIPILLSGKNLLGMAQTGTGKTAAFGLPLIQRIDHTKRQVQALVLSPTRELAVQVASAVHDYSKHTSLRVVPVYGGQPIDRQIRALQQGAQVVCGTPGRLLDHLRRGSLNLDNVSYCVLDEADEMMALGFMEDMEAILAELPESRQIAFFSATMPNRIASMIRKFCPEFEQVAIEPQRRTVDNTNQVYYEVPAGKKLEALARVLDMEVPGPSIVFCRTRQDTQELAEALRLRGYNSEPLHGDMGQTERDRVMRRFREGLADLLIATDVAARGLDIDGVTHVINYDIPGDVDQYIHRIGRTGRAGRTGDAITLVEPKERRQLKNIERVIGTRIEAIKIPSVADIAERRHDLLKESVREALVAGKYERQLATVAELGEEFSTDEIAAAAIYMLWESKHAIAEQDVQDFEQPETGMARIFIGMGRQDGLRPADVVGAITHEAGLEGRQVGAIDILDRSAFVEVPAGAAEMVVESLRRAKIRRRKVKIELARPAAPRQ